MERIQLSPYATRIRLTPEDAEHFAPVVFSDDSGDFLVQTRFECSPKPVRRLCPDAGQTNVLQTANGEVSTFDGRETELLRTAASVRAGFTCPEGQILTGLGQHEDGIFDYARRKERLYQHNMKIAVPFLLSSAGWGLLVEAGCAMRYEGKGNGFVFELDAVQELSYVVIRARNCAEVLKNLLTITGKPVLLPKWAYGYIQSKERYKTAAELTDTFQVQMMLEQDKLNWMLLPVVMPNNTDPSKELIERCIADGKCERISCSDGYYKSYCLYQIHH